MKTLSDVGAIISSMQLPYSPSDIQRADALDAYTAGRFGLFYDVGGGKTLVSTIVALLFDTPVVVLVPPILIPQWIAWLEKVQITDIGAYYGTKRTTESFRKKWLITSHAIFRKDYDKFRAYYQGRQVTLLVDEAQAIKNPASKLHRCSLAFIGTDKPCVLMSATPTAKPEDTYAYMKVKTPSLYRSMTHWENLHVEERNIFNAITKYKNLELLKNNFAINAAKRDKVTLMGYNLKPIYDTIEYQLGPKHTVLYRKLLDEQLLLLDDGTKIDATTAQKMRHRMQQIIWNYAGFAGDPDVIPAGIELLAEICSQVDFMDQSKSKFIIWTGYKSTSALIFEWMKKQFGEKSGVAAYSDSNSAAAVQRIMFDPTCRWMVAHPLSVGAGLELQHVCSEMFFAELLTSPIPVRQAIGRCDRPGQKVPPTIRFAIAQGTVQRSLMRDLLKNDEMVAKVERTRTSLKQDLLGE